MAKEKLQIQNRSGKILNATLELPEHTKPFHYAIFAHCFTCSSEISAVRNVTRSLASKGFAVLRFDFTGLGKSEGNFAESHFSANVADLVDVHSYLTENYEEPSLLVGHSLGGAAVLAAAASLPAIKAIATVGAPADVAHVKHLFVDQLPGEAFAGKQQVTIGGRPFEIDEAFVQELNGTDLPQIVKGLRRPLLVMHAPSDRIVGVENAKKIYDAAMHPKSFVSLDNADHLLSKKQDGEYVGQLISAWASRYFEFPEEAWTSTDGEQVVGHLDLIEDKFTTRINTAKHALVADEPASIGGDDFGPSPYELLNASLIACTAMTLKMYAQRKGWDLQEVTVWTTYSKKHSDDINQEVSKEGKVDHILKRLELKGMLSDEQRQKLKEIASKCPVHRTLLAEVVIETTLKD